MKTENKMTTDKHTKQAPVTKDKKNNESVNTQHHKKQVKTTNENKNQEKLLAKGGGK